MGMYWFDVTRSLPSAGRLWPKDVNKGQNTSAKQRAYSPILDDMVDSAKSAVAGLFGTPSYATLVA